jgi:alpha-tubulin suppressor-like RCC1 family protein
MSQSRSTARALALGGGLVVGVSAGACGDSNNAVGTPAVIVGQLPDGGSDGGTTGASDAGGDGASPDGGAAPPRSMLAIGDGFACILAKDGTVSCWGKNDVGQLGRDPASTPSCGSAPCSPTPTSVAGLTGIVKIAAGDDFACALDASRAVWCWGNNAKGQLEATAAATSFTPKKLIVDIADVVAAGTHACVLTADAAVRCWGENTCNIFGGGAALQRSANIIPGPNMAQLSIGRDAICGVTTGDGHVLCWGADHKGSLGHDVAPSAPLCNGYPSDSVPKSVQQSSDGLPLTDVAEVQTGNGVTCARHTGGQVLCWGDNSRGGLGQGIADGDPHARAVEVPSLYAAKLLVGEQTACAIVANRLLCWGDSADGQLETLSPSITCGNQSCRALGYAVTNMMPVHAFAVGRGTVGAIKDDLSVWLWGANGMGQLSIASSAPGNVSCPAGTCVPSPTQAKGLPPLD